jgi:hypothetical protein
MTAITSRGSLASKARRRELGMRATGTRSRTGSLAVPPQRSQWKSSQTSMRLPFALTRNRSVQWKRRGPPQR